MALWGSVRLGTFSRISTCVRFCCFLSRTKAKRAALAALDSCLPKAESVPIRTTTQHGSPPPTQDREENAAYQYRSKVFEQ
eukprot:3841779-Amphidinium_carterae.1